jgi:hypothetical protein
MDLAAKYDLVIEQGATLTRVFRWEDSYGNAQDLGSYTLRMDIRETRESTTALATTEGSTPNITIAKSVSLTGVFTVSMTAAKTALLDFIRGVYDIEAYTADATPIVYRLFEGGVTLSKEVTR